MKIRTFLALAGLAALALVWAPPAGARQQSDKELLAELRKLAEPPDLDKEKFDTPDAFKALMKKRGDAALGLLKDFEARHGKSPLLHEARAETLKALTFGNQPQAGAVELAKKIVADAPKGSDFAAQADLVLAMQEFEAMFKDAKKAEDLKDLWHKNAETIRTRIGAYLTAYPKFRLGADVAGQLARLAEQVDDPKTHRLIVDAVAKNLPDHPLAKVAKREQAVGKEFPFEYTPVGGQKRTSLKDLRGKVVVIDFWATWCGPCKAEIPAMKKLYEEYGKKGLEIIGVSLDEKEAALTDYVKDKGVPWPQVFGKDAQALADEWGVEAIPAVFIIDRQGRLRSLNARGKLEKLVPELLGEK